MGLVVLFWANLVDPLLQYWRDSGRQGKPLIGLRGYKTCTGIAGGDRLSSLDKHLKSIRGKKIIFAMAPTAHRKEIPLLLSQVVSDSAHTHTHNLFKQPRLRTKQTAGQEDPPISNDNSDQFMV